MKKLKLFGISLLLTLSLYSQSYPIVEEFNSGTSWIYTNGAGMQNYGGTENYATFNLGSTPYPNNSTITITSPTYNFTTTCGSNLTISFPISGVIQNNKDFVYFEYFSGGSWITQSTLTYVQNTTYSYSIPNTATQFRFRLVTDCSVNGYKGGNPSCSLTGYPTTCTPNPGNCSGLISVYYYDIARFTIDCSSPLPIKLLSFYVYSINDKVTIEWVTIEEKNNKYFIIEKSNDGKNWGFLTQIPGTTSDFSIKYSFIDNNPYKGDNYYRLSQTDNDGTITFLDIKHVNVIINNEKEIEYYNLQGIKVNIENCSQGIYIKKQGNKITKIIK